MRSFAFAVSLLVMGVAPAAAQQARALPPELRDGRSSLSFVAFPGTGAGLGYAVMISPRTAFTLDFSVQGQWGMRTVEDDGTTTFERDDLVVDAFIAPGLRRYMSGRGEVASYMTGRLLFGAQAGVQETRTETETLRNEYFVPTGGIAGGLGLEWFVTDAMSLRGEFLLDVTYRYRSIESPDGRTDTDHLLDVGLDQSGVAVSIWF